MLDDSALPTVLRYVYGFWASAILATAIKHRIFVHIEAGAHDAEKLAANADISLRGSQAILDGVLGLGLLRKTSLGYENTESTRTYFLPGSRDYVGGYADMILSTLTDWGHLPESVRTGLPLHRQEGANANNAFWENLVRGIAPLSFAPARIAAERLRLADRKSFRVLDIAGGAGAYSAIWLGLNENARCVNLDWPNVNRIAREYVDSFGHGEHFSTLDGDMETLDIPAASYDCAIYSNIAHGLSPERNTAMFVRIRRWLKPGGTLLISSLIPNEDRSGDFLLLMFNSNLLLNSHEGTIHTRADYSAWARAAGFTNIEFQPLSGFPFTLVYVS